MTRSIQRRRNCHFSHWTFITGRLKVCVQVEISRTTVQFVFGYMDLCMCTCIVRTCTCKCILVYHYHFVPVYLHAHSCMYMYRVHAFATCGIFMWSLPRKHFGLKELLIWLCMCVCLRSLVMTSSFQVIVMPIPTHSHTLYSHVCMWCIYMYTHTRHVLYTVVCYKIVVGTCR